jgi:hypothetical protein
MVCTELRLQQCVLLLESGCVQCQSTQNHTWHCHAWHSSYQVESSMQCVPLSQDLPGLLDLEAVSGSNCWTVA